MKKSLVLTREKRERDREKVLSTFLMRRQQTSIREVTDWSFFLICPVRGTPIWDPDAKGVYYGIDFSKTKGHFIRAAMEGTAYALKHNLDVAEEAGAKVTVMRAMGGSANSLLWTQIKSDITGKPIIVPSSDTATTLGAVILAGVGIGMYADFEEAVRLTVRDQRSHEPDQGKRAVYDENYNTYIELYQQLKGYHETKRRQINMKAAVVCANEDVRYMDYEEPVPGPGEVKVRVMASGICGSDIPRVLNHGVHFYPIVLGHEFSGYVTEVGAGVDGK